jgi:hypothetical protein
MGLSTYNTIFENYGTVHKTSSGVTSFPELSVFVNETTGIVKGIGTYDLTALSFSNAGRIQPGSSPVF